MVIYARLQSAHKISVILPTSSRKGGDISMKKADLLSTLFVEIDVSSRENVVCFLDFQSQKPLASFSVPNNQSGASTMADKIVEFMHQHKDLSFVTVALESTSYYGIHIANYLSSCTFLLPFNITVYCVNPMLIHSYNKTFVGMSKNDYVDAFAIADLARLGKITSSLWRGNQILALQRLTIHLMSYLKLNWMKFILLD